MFRSGVVLLAAGLLSGCVTGQAGTEYAVIAQKVGPPKPGHSRVVVLQEKTKNLGFSACACEMKLDGESLGKVIVGTYAYADRPAGPHQLIASEALFPGETRHDFTTAAGRTYYFLVKSSERHDAVTGGALVGGIAGIVATAVVTSGNQNAGPADLFPLDEGTARTRLAELLLAQ